MVHEVSVGEGDNSRRKLCHCTDVQHSSLTTHRNQLPHMVELGEDN